MDGVGDEVLSGAALSGEQDRRRLHVLESPEHLEELPHGGRLTDDRGVAAGAALAQVVDLCRQAVGLQPLLDRQGDLAQVEGLREVAVRSELRRRDRAVDRAVRREHHDGKVSTGLPNGPDELQPAHARHLQVGQHQVGSVLFDSLEPFLAVAGLDHAIAKCSHVLVDGPTDEFLVVDDEDCGFLTHGWVVARGLGGLGNPIHMVCKGRAIPGTPLARYHDVMNQLSNLGEVIRWRRGERLWDEGQGVKGLVVVRSGALELQKTHSSGVLSLDLVVRGEIAGTEALVCDAKYGHSAVGVGYGSGTWVPEARLYAAMLDTPDLGAEIFRAHLARCGRIATAFADLEFAPVEARVARLMLRLCDTIGLPDARGTFIPLRLYKVQIARLTACRAETVIRLLKRWREREILLAQREGFVVPDRGRVSALVDVEEECSYAM